MKLESTCPCGATFTFEADDKSFATLEGAKLWEKWKDDHKNHKASIVKEFFKE